MDCQHKNCTNSSNSVLQAMFELSFNSKEFFRILTASDFDAKIESDAKKWIDDRWMLVLQICTIYVLSIFGIQRAMKNRRPFELFIPLNAWNLLLAVFSTIGAIRLSPEFFGVLFNNGFRASYCDLLHYTEGTHGYWMWLFIVSKMFELVDTYFLVLRKKPLLFLHWYHHVLTMVYAFYSYPTTPGFNRWGIYLNYCVHAFMYSYYFLRSMKIRVPGFIAKFITTIQIWQFIICVAILIRLGFLVYVENVACDLENRMFVMASFMDFTYLVLFINFFVKSYVVAGGKAKYRENKNKQLNAEETKDMLANDQQTNNAKYHAYSNGTTTEVRRRN